MTAARRILALALIALAVGGCPPDEGEERRAAALTFLGSPPTPSSIEVLQPDAATKLAEVEPEIADEAMRENLIRALVLIDDEASRELLVELLRKEPKWVPAAFDTARQFGKLEGQLAVLYDQLDEVSRESAFLEVCWAAYVDGTDEALVTSCRKLWAASDVEIQARWLRSFTHAGPQDDAAPYEALREGIATDLVPELDEIVLRIGGGEVVPDDPQVRKAMRLSSLLQDRRSRYSQEATGAPTVPVEGGYVELIPPDPGTDFGRVASWLLPDAPLSCAGAWGATAAHRARTVLEVQLHGTRQAPTVTLIASGSDKKSKAGSTEPAEEGAEVEATPEETLRACLEQGLGAVHGGGSAAWVPRSGTTRLTVQFQKGTAPWTRREENRVVLADEDLRLMGDRLRETGDAPLRDQLDLSEHELPPLRDLGATDLGFCLAYLDQGWTDCAVWLGEAATLDEPLQAALRRGLRDVDPAVRKLCRTALAVSMDEEAIDKAAEPPEETNEEEGAEGTEAASTEGSAQP